MADAAMVDGRGDRSRRTSTSGMPGDEGEADKARYLLPSAYASVVVPLSRLRLSCVSASDSTRLN
eukprot:6159109-Prymnesium_polylepis.1